LEKQQRPAKDSWNKKASPESMPKKRKISFFGHFGSNNFGNEGTLEAILWNLRRLLPEAEFTCICTDPTSAAGIHNIKASAISHPLKGSRLKNRIARLLGRVFLRIPRELYHWWEAFARLKGTDALIIPGTGLLTDAFGVLSWGPYNLFKWSILARLRGSKLFFVSVGAGPLNGRLSRLLVTLSLGLADFRSYRDASSLRYLKDIGFSRTHDRVYPDLAFSLPKTVVSLDSKRGRRRPVAGLGLMSYGSMYGDNKPTDASYDRYLESFVSLAKFLLDRGYDIRLIIGELADPQAEFRRLLEDHSVQYDPSRIVDSPAESVDVQRLLAQIAETDLVVATRFHNVLYALLNNKPTVSISFHNKCADLMSSMGLSEYCLDVNGLRVDAMIEKVRDIEKNSDNLESLIAERAEQFREELQEQYGIIVKHL
jgi:polysaccharide pyruvyl transferase WcaK-like protein